MKNVFSADCGIVDEFSITQSGRGVAGYHALEACPELETLVGKRIGGGLFVVINLEELDQANTLQRLQGKLGRIHQFGVATPLLHRGERAHQHPDAAGIEHLDVAHVEDNARVARAQSLSDGPAKGIHGVAYHEVAVHADDLHVVVCVFADLYFHVSSTVQWKNLG